MTTSSDGKKVYPPKKRVPEGKFLLVRIPKAPTEAKPFTKTVTNKETGAPESKEVRQVNLHFQIADKRHPELCGQWHIMQATDFISGDSKLFSVLSALLGPEVVGGLIGKSCFPRMWPDGNRTPLEKLVPVEMWNGLAGKFFGAEFNPPKADDAGNPRLSEDGSPFQTVKDINTLDALGWTEDQWKLWPPPKPEAGQQTSAPQEQAPAQRPAAPPQEPPKAPAGQGIGLPTKPGATPAQPPAPPNEESKAQPEPPPFTRTFGTPQQMVDELIALCTAHKDFVALKDAFLKLKGSTKVMKLTEGDIRHLLVLFWLDEHRMGGGLVSAHINEYLIRQHRDLHQLDAADAITLLAASDHESADDIPF